MEIDRLAEIRHNIRSFLNHIVGYSDIAAGDPALAGVGELRDLFVKIRNSAIDLNGPVSSFFSKRIDDSAAAELKQRIYGLLYDIIAYVQTAKRNDLVSGEKTRLEDVELILRAANNIVEIFEDEVTNSLASMTDPAVPDQVSTIVESSEGLAKDRIGRILLVDDDATNRALLTRHVERQGHLVCSADSGLAALDMMRKAPFDIVIIDVMMPGMNGYQLLERLKSDPALHDVFVIVISALDESFSIAKCIQLGAEDYLPRQYDPVILRARIESCLEKKRMREREAMYMNAVVTMQDKLEREMRNAADYVESLLPARIRTGPVRADWQFIPSLSLGGDIFNYHWIGTEGRTGGGPEGLFSIFMIDVSGHGIASALVSVTLMNILKNRTLVGADFSDPASVLSRLNASFQMEDQDNLFVSIWYGVYDARTRAMRYASAAIPPALLIGPDGSVRQLATGGIAVGVDSGARYVNETVEIPETSNLYIFSDGIYEVFKADGAMLGYEMFSRLLARRNQACRIAADCPSFAESTIDAVRKECGVSSFVDDVSIIVLSFE